MAFDMAPKRAGRAEIRVLGLKTAGIPILSTCARYPRAAVSRAGITSGEDSPTHEVSAIAIGHLRRADQRDAAGGALSRGEANTRSDPRGSAQLRPPL